MHDANIRMPDALGLGKTAELSTARGLDGLRVLFLPKNSRTIYFQELLQEARQRHGWRIRVAGPAGTDGVWRRAIDLQGEFISLPDFTLPDAWEKDRAAADTLDAFIVSCEWASGASVGRIILAGERDLGRGFSWPIYYWFHNRIARRVLADNTEPLRMVRRMFAFARATLADRPDLVMAGEWADPVCFVFYLAARQMGIPCVANRLSKLWSGRCYWSARANMYNENAHELARARYAEDQPISRRAGERLMDFRASPQTLGYVRTNWESLDRRGWLGNHAQFARMLINRVLHTLRRRRSEPKPAFRLLGAFYQQQWLRLRQSGYFHRFGEAELRDMRYLLVALHKDPEQALNFQAPFWSNQFNTIELLSSSLPNGFRLLVREHRNNIGRRPTRFYKDMLRLPGVVLVDGFDEQFKYIRNADLIVTDNGSTGWEGLVLGRRVITLADNYYNDGLTAKRVHDPDTLSTTIVRVLEEPLSEISARDRALGAVLDAEWESSAPLDPAERGQALALLANLYARISTTSVKTNSVSA